MARNSRTDEGLQLGRAEELALAQRCAQGDREARTLFAKLYLTTVPNAVRHLGRREFGDEVQQLLSLRLLECTDGNLPKIAAYNGSGALGAWVRVAAVRLALDLLKALQRENKRTGLRLEELPDPFASQSSGVHKQLLRLQHQQDLRAALKLAFAELSDTQKLALKLHYLHGLSTEEASRILGVHKATAARWIAHGRAAVLESTLRALQDRLGISETEAKSLAGLVDSNFECTTDELLRVAG